MTTQELTTTDAVIVGVLDQMDATEARERKPDNAP